MTHVAWKNHVNGARNPKAQFRSRGRAGDDRRARPRSPAGSGVFDCSGVSDGAACALIVRAEDAYDYTDRRST